MAKSGSCEQRLQRRPAARARDAELAAGQQAAAGEHLDVARLVGGLDGEQLHDLAEVRVEPAEQPGRDEQRRLLVLDQVRHDLHDGALRSQAARSTGAYQSTAVAGIPLARPRRPRTAAGPRRPRRARVRSSRRRSAGRRPRRARRGRPGPRLASARCVRRAVAAPARRASRQRCSLGRALDDRRLPRSGRAVAAAARHQAARWMAERRMAPDDRAARHRAPAPASACSSSR